MSRNMTAIAGALCLAVLATAPGEAKVVGMNQPAQSVTAARFAGLPASQRAAWSAYLAKSIAAMHADKAVLAAERSVGTPVPPAPETGNGLLTMPLAYGPTAMSRRAHGCRRPCLCSSGSHDSIPICTP